MSIAGQINCETCGNHLQSIKAKKAWELAVNGELIESSRFFWLSCPKCEMTTVLDNDGIMKPPYPINVFIPHFCPKCHISFFSSTKECQLCGFKIGE